MKKIFGISLLLALSASMSGCGFLFGDHGLFRDRSDDYRQATLTPPLKIPPGLDGDAIDDQLVIPHAKPGQVALTGKFEVPQPEPANPAAQSEAVRLQTLGQQSWILVEASPGEVWPRVRQFLGVNRIAVLRADATAGIIETAWLQPASQAGRERYRFRIEQGVQRGSSEIYITQQSAAADANVDVDSWPKQSSNPERATTMRKALAQFIADNGTTGAVSMLAQQGIRSQGKVFFVRTAGHELRLRLDLPFDRAWASLDTALPKGGFAEDDRNRSEHKIWVHYAPSETDDTQPKRGFFGSIWHWLFGSSDKGNVLSDHKTVYIVTMQPAADGSAQMIGIDRQDGKPLEPNAREQLLTLIKTNLS